MTKKRATRKSAEGDKSKDEVAAAEAAVEQARTAPATGATRLRTNLRNGGRTRKERLAPSRSATCSTARWSLCDVIPQPVYWQPV